MVGVGYHHTPSKGYVPRDFHRKWLDVKENLLERGTGYGVHGVGGGGRVTLPYSRNINITLCTLYPVPLIYIY